MQRLPGFRDFYPDDCAFRNYLFDTWRSVARSYGFQEYEGPTLEPTELYRKKSGEELKTQLFRFLDPGSRDVCLRPEMTPTLARLVAAREREFRKPLKWFSIAPFYRFERPQKGRLREFFQLNCDIIGDDSPAADAELIALAIDLHRRFGLGPNDFYVRLNDRRLWLEFLQEHAIGEEALSKFLAVIDKIEREEPERTDQQLQAFGLHLADVHQFLARPATSRPRFATVLQELEGRGLAGYVEVDLTIVRGLDYYTGLVFEVFDRQRTNRSLAGGGRYDQLIALISDQKVDLPAAGFAVGDVVLGEYLQEIEAAKVLAAQARQAQQVRVFVIVAGESFRTHALELLQSLREQGIAADFSLQPAKVGRQFQQAEALGAEYAVMVGQEWPRLMVKKLADRSEQPLRQEELLPLLSDAARSSTRFSHVSHPSL